MMTMMNHEDHIAPHNDRCDRCLYIIWYDDDDDTSECTVVFFSIRRNHVLTFKARSSAQGEGRNVTFRRDESWMKIRIRRRNHEWRLWSAWRRQKLRITLGLRRTLSEETKNLRKIISAREGNKKSTAGSKENEGEKGEPDCNEENDGLSRAIVRVKL
jgi:hypothetical protein